MCVFLSVYGMGGFFFLQAISIRFYKAMGSCLYMCRSYVGECGDMGPSAGVFAWVCG